MYMKLNMLVNLLYHLAIVVADQRKGCGMSRPPPYSQRKLGWHKHISVLVGTILNNKQK